jgi:hypothetical protein
MCSQRGKHAMRLVDMGDGRYQIDDDRLQHYEHIFISPHEGSYYVQYTNTRDLSDLILVQDEKRHEVMLFPNTDIAALSAETWLDQIDVLREWAVARHKRAPLFVERVSILRSLEDLYNEGD